LLRPGEETSLRLTDLLEATPYPAPDLVELDWGRWSSERVFQQITAVLPLQTLIGTTPHGTVFQRAFWLVRDTLGQVLRA
jgi:hypothetical protein